MMKQLHETVVSIIFILFYETRTLWNHSVSVYRRCFTCSTRVVMLDVVGSVRVVHINTCVQVGLDEYGEARRYKNCNSAVKY